jgi:hypothetical protein
MPNLLPSRSPSVLTVTLPSMAPSLPLDWIKRAESSTPKGAVSGEALASVYDSAPLPVICRASPPGIVVSTLNPATVLTSASLVLMVCCVVLEPEQVKWLGGVVRVHAA